MSTGNGFNVTLSHFPVTFELPGSILLDNYILFPRY